MSRSKLEYLATVIDTDEEEFVHKEKLVKRGMVSIFLGDYTSMTRFDRADFLEQLDRDGIAHHWGTRPDGRIFEVTVIKA